MCKWLDFTSERNYSDGLFYKMSVITMRISPVESRCWQCFQQLIMSFGWWQKYSALTLILFSWLRDIKLRDLSFSHRHQSFVLWFRAARALQVPFGYLLVLPLLSGGSSTDSVDPSLDRPYGLYISHSVHASWTNIWVDKRVYDSLGSRSDNPTSGHPSCGYY